MSVYVRTALKFKPVQQSRQEGLKAYCSNIKSVAIGVLHEAPSRIVGSELIKSDDDLFMLNTAQKFEAIILSNDR